MLKFLLLFLASLGAKLACYCSLICYFNHFEFASKQMHDYSKDSRSVSHLKSSSSYGFGWDHPGPQQSFSCQTWWSGFSSRVWKEVIIKGEGSLLPPSQPGGSSSGSGEAGWNSRGAAQVWWPTVEQWSRISVRSCFAVWTDSRLTSVQQTLTQMLQREGGCWCHTTWLGYGVSILLHNMQINTFLGLVYKELPWKLSYCFF